MKLLSNFRIFDPVLFVFNDIIPSIASLIILQNFLIV